jgi:hypothetical protein
VKRLGALAVALAAAVSLSGCGRHHRSSDEFDASKIPLTPLPPLPDWAAPLLGRNTDCKGAFDAIYNLHPDPAKGAQANGWGWLTLSKSAPTQIVITTPAGTIVGAGTVDYDRPDVHEVLPDVTATRVGWHAVIKGGSNSLTAMALLPNNGVCELGTKDAVYSAS